MAHAGALLSISTAGSTRPLLAPPQGGSTALFYASGQEDVGIVHSLLQAGASCSLANPNGQLPVHFACQIGSLPVLQALAAHGSSVVAADASGAWMTPGRGVLVCFMAGL